jgi:apolipoprotein N-acyltransferase
VFALPFFVVFVGYYALQIALFAAGVAWASRQQPATPVVFAAAWWVLLEWGFPKIIPWSFGDTLAASPLLRQGADLCGVYGLSFFILIVNACCAAAVTQRRAPPTQRLRPVATAATLMLAAAAYGALRLHQLATPADDQLNVVIVQGGLHSGRDDLDAANEEAWSTYSTLSTQDSALRTDLLVWPETVLRVYLRQDDGYRERVIDLVRRLQQPLLVGSLDLPRAGSGELNSAYLVEPGPRYETDMQVYHKLELLPFGEYVPATNILPFLSRWQTTGRFVAGEPARPIALRGAHRRTHEPIEHDSRARLTTTSFAPSICFEAVRSGAFNQLVREGAEFLLNLTDDGWFGDSAGPYQHLNAATLRAVETRRWLVRASNSGVSAFVDPTGQIVASLPLGAIGVLRHAVTPSRVSSIYVRYGNWPVTLSCALIFGSFVKNRSRSAG